MSDEKLSALFRAGVVVAVFGGVILTHLNFARTPKPVVSIYFLARDAVAAKVNLKIRQFIPPDKLLLQRIDDNSTNVSGWFRAEFGQSNEASPEQAFCIL